MGLKEENPSMYAQGVICDALDVLLSDGFEIKDITAIAVGICRLAMERDFGREAAIEMDNEWKASVGWGIKDTEIN